MSAADQWRRTEWRECERFIVPALLIVVAAAGRPGSNRPA